MNVSIVYRGGIDPQIDLSLKNSIPGEFAHSGCWLIGDNHRDIGLDNVPWTLAEVEQKAREICGDRFVIVVDRDDE